ncbi:MAG: NfeD family protein [Myxococcota bacterium]
MRTFGRYVLLQIPELAGLAVLLWVLCRGLGLIGSPLAAGLWLAFVALQLALYPFVRRGYETTPSAHGPEALIGALGVTTATLAPEGWVRVRQELWRAKLSDPVEGPVQAGTQVRVEQVHELTLRVRPADKAASAESPRRSRP